MQVTETQAGGRSIRVLEKYKRFQLSVRRILNLYLSFLGVFASLREISA
jgi:hypothetical protein